MPSGNNRASSSVNALRTALRPSRSPLALQPTFPLTAFPRFRPRPSAPITPGKALRGRDALPMRLHARHDTTPAAPGGSGPPPDSLAGSLAAQLEIERSRNAELMEALAVERDRAARAEAEAKAQLAEANARVAELFGFHRGGRVRTGTRACRRSRPRPRRSTGWRDPRTHPGCRRGRPPRRAAGAAPRG